nr:MAK10-like protein [Tanacetum cinerariifolium]
CSTHIHGSINAITIHPKQSEESQVNKPDVGQEEGNLGNTNYNPHPQTDPLAPLAIEQVQKLNSMLELLRLVPRPLNVKFVCSKEGDGEVMFIEIIQDDDEPRKEGPNKGEGETNKGPEIMKRKLDPRENLNRGGSNFTGRIKGMHVFVGNFTYVVDFMIVEEISSIIDPRNHEDMERGVEYVMNKILGFYKECVELGPEYVTGLDDEGEVT